MPFCVSLCESIKSRQSQCIDLGQWKRVAGFMSLRHNYPLFCKTMLAFFFIFFVKTLKMSNRHRNSLAVVFSSLCESCNWRHKCLLQYLPLLEDWQKRQFTKRTDVSNIYVLQTNKNLTLKQALILSHELNAQSQLVELLKNFFFVANNRYNLKNQKE